MSITLSITFILLGIIGVWYEYLDIKHREVDMYMSYLFAMIGYIGVYIDKAINGSFQWYYLLAIPIFIILVNLNTKLNHEKIVGRGDLDIIIASIGLAIPTIIYIFTAPYCDCAPEGVQYLVLQDYILQLITFWFIGLVAIAVIGIGKWIYQRFVKKIHAKIVMPAAIGQMPMFFLAVYLAATLVV